MKIKLLTVLCAITISLGSVTNGRASDSSDKSGDNDKSAAIVADVALARPGCLIATVFGSAVFVIALPFAVISKSVHKTAHALVVCPAQATFTRPLGDFSHLGNLKQ
jgi:hypothetical protein